MILRNKTTGIRCEIFHVYGTPNTYSLTFYMFGKRTPHASRCVKHKCEAVKTAFELAGCT